jgi:glutathione S-transferase
MPDANHILFFSPGACSFGAIVTLEWLGQPYQLCKVERAERQTPAYKKINDQAQVPALKTGGRILTENTAILQHLAGHDLAKGLSFRQGTPEFDTMNMALSYYGSNFHVAFHPFFAPQRFHDDEKTQAQIKEKAISNIRGKYEFVEKCFAGRERHFEKPTIADAYAYGMLRWGAKLFDIPKEFPNTARFMAAQERDQAFKFALAAEAGEVAKSPNGFKGFVRLEDVEVPQCKAA